MTEEFKNQIEESGVYEYGCVPTESVTFYHEVRKMCEVNTCGSYDKKWSCPPGVGTVEECETRCKKYKTMLVFSGKYDLEDSFDYEGMEAGQADFKKVVRALEKNISPILSDYMMLSNEGCDLCGKCTYPDPCRFPEKVHGTIEGYGIFVSELAKSAGMKYNNGENTVTYFAALLFNE